MVNENRLLHRPSPDTLAFYPSVVSQAALTALGAAMIAVGPLLLSGPHGRLSADPLDVALAAFGLVFGLYMMGLAGPQSLTIGVQDRRYRAVDYRKIPLTRFAHSVAPPRYPFIFASYEGDIDADSQGVALREVKGGRSSSHWVVLVWNDETRIPITLAFTRDARQAQTLLTETAALVGLPAIEKHF